MFLSIAKTEGNYGALHSTKLHCNPSSKSFVYGEKVTNSYILMFWWKFLWPSSVEYARTENTFGHIWHATFYHDQSKVSSLRGKNHCNRHPHNARKTVFWKLPLCYTADRADTTFLFRCTTTQFNIKNLSKTIHSVRFSISISTKRPRKLPTFAFHSSMESRQERVDVTLE